MSDVNGYFQLMNTNGITFIKLIPEEGNGAAIDINDIADYMKIHKIDDYNLVEINKQLAKLKTEQTIMLSQSKIQPVSEYMKIMISEDKMTASVRFYPPSSDGKRISVEDMKGDLRLAGIKYGIYDSVLIRQFAKPSYCTDFIIARGKEVRQGKNAYIEYRFNTDRRIKPKHNEDGSVDFHQLNNISHINKGDTLAVLYPEDKGESGLNVMGEEIKPYQVSSAKLSYGKNIELSEDKLSIISLVDGHATLEGERVFVSNIFDVPGDVDNSTGDISYEGDVIVHGNVRTGFKIKTAGDVEIFGSVEGAEIISGGQVILHHGMQGMTKGKIVAKGNIITKFIESAKVYTEGDVVAEAIIQSQVSAGGDVVVNGVRGHIIGGHVRSTKVIEAKVIGSGMGIATIIEVGYNPEAQDKIAKIKEKMAEENAEYKKLAQVADVLNKRMKTGIISNEQKLSYKNCLNRLKELKEDLLSLQDRLDTNIGSLSNTEGACIKVQKVVYPGTQFIISGEYYNVLDEHGFCKFMKKDGKIVTIPL